MTAPDETVGLRRARRVEGLVAAVGMRARVLAFRQEEGLLAAGPWGIFPKELRGGSPFQLSSETLAAAFPFSSGGLNHGHGVILGLDADGGIVLIDRWQPPGDDITNKNFAILAPPGGGKSVAARAMLLREWQMGAKVVAVDPEKREYQRMCHRIGGGHLYEYCKAQKGDDWRILVALLQDAAEGIAAQIWAGPSTVPSTAEADFVVLDIQDLAAAPDRIKRAQFFNILARPEAVCPM